MKHLFIITVICCLSIITSAQVKLPALVRDSMILQRDTKINIWGWASADEKISIKLNNKTYRTSTGKDGKWVVSIDAMKAGGPYSMVIEGKNKIILNEILFGDVWICSGQSNMVHQLSLHSERYADEIAKANYPAIRHFWIPTLTDLQQSKDNLPSGYWKSANPTDILGFSAVAYFFAKNIYDKHHIPIGLINASAGGTPIEAWTSEEGLKDFTAAVNIIKQNKDTAYVNATNRKAFEFNAARKKPDDKGLTAPVKWFEENYVPVDWKPINIPGYWEDQGIRNFDGIVWYRKEINVPSSMEGKEARLYLGRIVDADIVYVNGKQVGNTTYQYPQRRYKIPAGILKAGKNVIAIKVINYNNKGGFVTDKPYWITGGSDTIDLKGTWHYEVGDVFTEAHRTIENISFTNQPTALYNAMIAPLTNYKVKGFLWYQGEANASRNANAYYDLLPALIRDWRSKWQQPDAPFIYAQLPNYMEVQYTPSESSWAVTRDAQRKTLAVPNTAMAITIDLGEWNDIHPGNKKDVGERMAIAARKLVYGENIIASGPLYDSYSKNEEKILIHFNHAGTGLTTKNSEAPREFAIAGNDKKFVWANALIKNNSVEVWNDAIQDPRYVRYAWADNPGTNLYNKEGLPASPFQFEILDSLNPAKPWNYKKAAVVLTYDDALNVHLSNAIPLLDSLGLKGTFYICNNTGQLQHQMNGWKKAAANGHELGNHTLFHPCEGQRKGREWVQPEQDLLYYTIKRMQAEARAMNVLLQAIDGKQKRTFAFPCADLLIKDTPYIKYLGKDFIAARSVRSEMIAANDAKLYDLPCYMINGETGEQLIALVTKAVEEKKLLILLFHGVGGEHGLNVSLESHRQLLQYLDENRKDVWVAPLVEVAEFIKNKQQ